MKFPFNVQQLSKIDCKGLHLCLPYGRCCKLDQYCNPSIGGCSSCFPGGLPSNEQKLEFCHKAVANVTLYKHPSCGAACQYMFGRDAYPATESETGISIQLCIGLVLAFLILGIILGIILGRYGRRMLNLLQKCRRKKKDDHRPNLTSEESEKNLADACNSQEIIDKQKTSTIHKTEDLSTQDETVPLTMDNESVYIQCQPTGAPVDQAMPLGCNDNAQGIINFSRVNMQSPPAAAQSPNAGGATGETPDGPCTPEEDQRKNRCMHLPETDGHAPSSFTPSGNPHSGAQC